jgi:hypothetical protein
MTISIVYMTISMVHMTISIVYMTISMVYMTISMVYMTISIYLRNRDVYGRDRYLIKCTPPHTHRAKKKTMAATWVGDGAELGCALTSGGIFLGLFKLYRPIFFMTSPNWSSSSTWDAKRDT